MQLVNRLIFGFFALFISVFVAGQFYQSGQDAPDVRWNQLRTTGFRLIYPVGMDSLAMDYARYLHHVAPVLQSELNHRPRTFPIILRPYASESNGFVVWAPRRMELYTREPASGLSVPWTHQLAAHEYRHVVQIDKLNMGFTKVAGWLLGEQATGLTAAFVPRWFYEGDAVDAETRYCATGRGHLPEFSMPWRMLANERTIPYSYEKMLFGSYRHHVPDAYESGYQLVRYARQRYGTDVWARTLDFVGRYPFTFMPFYFGLRKAGPESKNSLYHMAIGQLREPFRPGICNPGVKISPLNPSYVQYRSPQWADKGIISLKTSLDEAPCVVFIDSAGIEHRLVRTGYVFDNHISASGQWVAWSEYQTDERWGNRSYAEIRIFDRITRKIITLRDGTQWFMPALSPDGQYVALVENDSAGNGSLLIIDLKTRQPKWQWVAPRGSFYQYPAWSAGSDSLLAIVRSERGKQIVWLATRSMHQRVLTTPGLHEITHLQWWGREVIFRGTAEGTDAIYALRLADQQLTRVAKGPYGCFDPAVSPDGRRLVYAGYSQGGYELYEMSLETHNLQQPGPMVHLESPNTTVLSNELPFEPQLQRYRKIPHSLHIHSWAPIYYNLEPGNLAFEEIPVYPGLQVFSQDLTGNTVTSAGILFKEGQPGYSFRTSWKGWYPVLDLSVHHYGQNTYWYPDDVEKPQGNKAFTQWEGTIYLPLNFSSGARIQTFVPQISLMANNNGYYDYFAKDFHEGMVFSEIRFSGTAYRRKATRDILPRLGVNYSVLVRTMPIDQSNFGSMNAAWLGVWLPGIGRHHTWQWTIRLNRQEPRNYYLPFRFNPGRGYTPIYTRQLVTLSGNYTLPIGYPDLNIGRLMYFKRLRANLFSDKSWSSPAEQSTEYWSAGAEWTVDFFLGHIPVPLSLQWQCGWLVNENIWFTAFTLNYSLNL